MPIPFKYTYFISGLVFLFFWLLVYLRVRVLRRELWLISSLVAVLSLASAYFWWTVDWWRPQTITGTRVGVEDLIIGFASGGVAAFGYQAIFGIKFNWPPKYWDWIFLMIFVASNLVIIALLVWGFKVSSFFASSVAMTAVALWLVLMDKNQLKVGVVSGLVTLLASLPFYYLALVISPGWVEETWLFDYLSGITLAGIPFEDLMFYFLFGFISGSFYDSWLRRRLAYLAK